MASMEPQKQLLSLIRDFAAEKSQGERRVSDLKKKLLNVVAATDAANAALDEAKRAKEVAERELQGSQVQLSMCDATIQAQLARISVFQGEISRLGSAIDQLKNETGVLRDDFIGRMQILNKKIRELLEMAGRVFQKEYPGTSSKYGVSTNNKEEKFNMQESRKDLERQLACIKSQIDKTSSEYQEQLQDYHKICQELANTEQRWLLVEAVVQETKSLQELSGQTCELEKTCASLGEKLQKRYECPNCHCKMGGLEAASET